MPLVIVCGYPSSGKTKRSLELANALRANGDNVVLINDESLHLHRSTAYSTLVEEKKSRATLLAAVERALSRNVTVIADGLNYIKGYRYQLYCLARAVSTPHCVLHCLAPQALVLDWNAKRLALQQRPDADPTNYNSGGYEHSIALELISRFEEPNNQTKWDHPLFSVSHDEPALPLEEMITVLRSQTSRPPSMATTTRPISDGNFVLELDRATKAVIETVLEQQQQYKTVAAFPDIDLQVPLTSSASPSQLQRIRRQFIHLNRLHPVDSSRIRVLFVQYLISNLQL